jgi:hypothetical protein
VITGVQVEREDEVSRDRRGKHSAKGRAREVADVVATVAEPAEGVASKGDVTVFLELRGGRSIARLADKLSEISGVFAVNAGETGPISE